MAEWLRDGPVRIAHPEERFLSGVRNEKARLILPGTDNGPQSE